MTDRIPDPVDAMLGVVLRRVVDELCRLDGDPAAYRSRFRKMVVDDMDGLSMPEGMSDPERYRTAAIIAFSRFMDA